MLILTRRHLLLGAAAASLGSFSPSAFGASAKAKRYRFATPGSPIDTGAAVIRIDAPLEQVLKVVQDYRKYRKILPRLEQSRIVAKKDGKTDVYMRAPILKGAFNIWGIARFGEPEPWKENGKRVAGKMVKGNLDAWHGAWKLEPDGADQTILRLEMFVDVAVPVPDSWVTPELEWAADKGVTAVRDIAQGRGSTVTKD